VAEPDASGSGGWTLRGVARTRLGGALVAVALAALLVLPPLGQRILATGPINGDDEARYPLLARDMLARGVWFDLHYRGELYRDKPPLYPWTIAAVSWIRGRVTEATAQAPVVLAAIGAVLGTFLLGDRLFGGRAGLWAALVLATTLGFLDLSQLVLPDMLVLAFATLAGYGFWRAERGGPGRGVFLAVFYGASALASFSKGPLGLLPLLAAGLWILTEHGTRGMRRLWSPVGIALFVLITLAWVGPFLALGARSWVEDSVQGDWLAWYMGRPDNLKEFGQQLFSWSLPWSLVSVLALASAVRARRVPEVRFALIWFAVPLVVVMLSAHLKGRYLLATDPGQALLIAWWAQARCGARPAAQRAMGWVALGCALVLIVALHRPRWWGVNERRYLVDLPWWQLLPVMVGIALIGAAAFWGLRLGRPALLVHGIVAGMVLTWGYGVWAFTERHNAIWNYRQLVADADRHGRDGGVAVFQHRDKWVSIDFYLGRSPRSIASVEQANEVLGRGRPGVVLMDDGAWARLRPGLSPCARVLERATIGGKGLLVVGAAGAPSIASAGDAGPCPAPR
jgi:4-amino-4-deoxy-L-arabinose transferase-like glycosyltransferase